MLRINVERAHPPRPCPRPSCGGSRSSKPTLLRMHARDGNIPRSPHRRRRLRRRAVPSVPHSKPAATPDIEQAQTGERRLSAFRSRAILGSRSGSHHVIQPASGFSMWSGLNLPLGSHQSAAMASNLAISAVVDRSRGPVRCCSWTIPCNLWSVSLKPLHSPPYDRKRRWTSFRRKSAQARTCTRRSTVSISRMLEVPGRPHGSMSSSAANPDGAPVVVLHGGPGGGCSARECGGIFDPKRWRIILFDQRGCGRSRPHASVDANNTTWHLVADIERIRARNFHIDRNGPCSADPGARCTGAGLRPEAHPERAAYRADPARVFSMSMQRELDWFYGGGAGQFWPEQWSRLSRHMVPEEERGDLICRLSTAVFFRAT
jgi:hypothetical protein